MRAIKKESRGRQPRGARLLGEGKSSITTKELSAAEKQFKREMDKRKRLSQGDIYKDNEPACTEEK